MILKRNELQTGSIIESASKQRYKIIDPDRNGGALCTRFIKTRKSWAKKTTWFEYDRDYTFTNIIFAPTEDI